VSIVCKAGVRSAQAAGYLLAQGAQVRNVTGGMLAWHEAGLPMHAHSGSEPTVA
jgi:rhodanese-related sulfurtransferase